MITYPPAYIFEPEYLKESGLTPAEAKYILDLREHIPDLNTAGFANATTKEILVKTMQTYWNEVENIINQQRTFTQLGMPPLPANFGTPVFNILDKLHERTCDKLIRAYNTLEDHQIDGSLIPLEHDTLTIRTLLGGDKQLFLRTPGFYENMYSGIEWKDVKYDGPYSSQDNTNIKTSERDDICKQYGLSYIAFSGLIPHVKQEEFLENIKVTANRINEKFNWSDPAMFGDYGKIGLNIKTNILSCMGSANKYGQIVLGEPSIGTLAHEWIHILDKQIGSANGVSDVSSYTNKEVDEYKSETDKKLMLTFDNLLKKIAPASTKRDIEQKAPNPHMISFHLKNIVSGVRHFDLYHIKSAFLGLKRNTAYWTQPNEKIARAFDAYITGDYNRNECLPPKISQNHFDSAFDSFAHELGPILVNINKLSQNNWINICNTPSQASVVYATPVLPSQSAITPINNSMEYMPIPTLDIHSGPTLSSIEL